MFTNIILLYVLDFCERYSGYSYSFSNVQKEKSTNQAYVHSENIRKRSFVREKETWFYNFYCKFAPFLVRVTNNSDEWLIHDKENRKKGYRLETRGYKESTLRATCLFIGERL